MFSVIYYASNVFISLGLTGGTIALLATGVTGVVFLISTIPAMVSQSPSLGYYKTNMRTVDH